MRLDTLAPRSGTLANGFPLTTASPAPRLLVPWWLRRAAGGIGELLTLVGIVLCFPLAILAIGIPIALCVRLVLWVVEVL